MNPKTTLVLLVLAVAGAVVLWFGPGLGPAPRHEVAADAGTRDALARLDPAKFTRVQVIRPGLVPIPMFQRKPGGAWSLPGQWPPRQQEVEQLMATLGQLHSRFEPEPLTGDPGLVNTLVVKLEMGDEKHTLTFGEKKQSGADENLFTRPTYLRLDDKPEIVRLGPGLIAALDRPTDYYQKRRLFPDMRIAKEDRPDSKGERRARGVAIDETAPAKLHYALRREGDKWELEKPIKDRLDPRAGDALLDAVPDVWAEQFVPTDPALVSSTFLALVGDGGMGALANGALWGTRQGLLARSGLESPQRTLTVTKADGEVVVLLIGNLSVPRSRSVRQPTPPGLPPGFQMPPRQVREDYRYAKLKGNDQIFEIKADRLKDVFVSLDSLRDAQVARFQPADAQRLEVRHGTKDIVLQRDGGRWKLKKPIAADADDAKVNELLDKLSQLQARGADVHDKARPAYGLDKSAAVITVTVKEEDTKAKVRPGKEKPKKERTLTLKVGKRDKELHKVYVQAEGWPRVNAVDDALAPLVDRPALAYRGKRVLDFLASDLDHIDIDHQGKKLTLKQTADGWQLTAPVSFDADSLKAGDLANSLAALEVLEFIDDAPKAVDLDKKYGLAKPSLKVTLTFKDKAKPPRTLAVGKARGAKPGYFAKVAGAPAVFAVSNTIHSDLARDALAYRPMQLWQGAAEDVRSVEVRRKDEAPYELMRVGRTWRVAGPFSATADPTAAQALAQKLAAPLCQSYKVNEAKDLAEYGLGKPAVTVTVTEATGTKHTLLVGKAAEGGHYSKLGDKPAVFVVEDALVKAVDHGALDRIFTGVVNLPANQVGTIRIKADGKAFKLERQGDRWRVLDAPGAPFAADAETMAPLAAVWNNLKVERFVAYGPKIDVGQHGLNAPAFTITAVVQGDGGKPSEHTIQLGEEVKGEKGARYALLSGVPGVAVLAPATTRALAHTPLDFVDRRVLKLDPAAVTMLQRHMGPAVLEVARKDGDWQLVKPAEEKADDRAVQDLIAQLGDLRAVRIAAYPVKDLAEFGLDKPAALVTIKLTGGKPAEHILKLGKVADAATGARYAVADGGKAVAVLPGVVARRLVAAPLAFRDRTLVRFADADKARLERGPRQAVFAKVEGTWKLIEPLRGDAEQDDLEEFINNGLAKLRADELVVEKPSAAQLKKYGLDKPELRWRLHSGDKEVLDLQVGNPDKGGMRRYARIAGRDLVFLLDPRLTARVTAEYRPRTVWTAPLDAVGVESVRFGYPRGAFTLEKSGSVWQVEGKPDAKVNTEAVNDALAALAGLKLERYAVDKDTDLKLFGLSPPQLVLEVATRSGKRILHIGGNVGETKARYARLPSPDRPGVFVLDEKTCTRIIRNLAAFTTPARPTP